MTDDRLSGSAKNIGGQVEEGFGRVTGDEKTQLQGKAKQAEGTLQDVYGQAKETAADAAEAIRGRASEAGDFLRTTIEERPFTAAAIALAELPQLEILWPMSFLPMSSDRIIVEAIKVGQNLLSQNLPPAHSLTDAATVMRFRELVRSQAIRSALERSSDTFPAFVLREVGHVGADQSKTNRQVISRLWGVFDDPHLNQA
jgi:uncharacterized protein YjbJ (UPF0337 family)